MHRAAEPFGTCLTRDQSVTFEFDGRVLEGLEGDTIVSALLANNVTTLSRSFKYHRPRSVLSATGLDANCYVEIDELPNQLGDHTLLRQGMRVTTQNVVGFQTVDMAYLLKFLHRFLTAGFYYQSFYRPRGIWRFWERAIRRTAGLGRVSPSTPLKRKPCRHLHCDVAVVGGGIAGLSAAISCAEAGLSTILVERDRQIGGYLRYGRISDGDARRAKSIFSAVASNKNIRIITGGTCTSWMADELLTIEHDSEAIRIRANKVILATGSIGQMATFRNNDLPGVMLASAAQRLLKFYGVVVAKNSVVVTANQFGYECALDMLDSGADVACLVDLRLKSDIQELKAELQKRGVKIFNATSVSEAVAKWGHRGVKAFRFVDSDGTLREIECDAVLVSTGFSPLGQLACMAGARMVYLPESGTLTVSDLPESGHVAGAVNSIWSIEAAIIDGRHAGHAATLAFAGAEQSDRNPIAAPEKTIVNHPWPIFPHSKGCEFVDFDSDQTVRDIHSAMDDGFDHVELVKRYTTTGMGPSQGRTGALNAIGIVAKHPSYSGSETVSTTQRPPFVPEEFCSLAGDIEKPLQATPMNEWHLQAGAQMMVAGTWKRPAYYGRPEQKCEAIRREVAAVRHEVGIIDGSTLGGLEVRGPDASKFMEAFYTFRYRKQAVASARYVLSTNDAGSIIDDGISIRRADDLFYCTTTSTHVDAVFRSMLLLRNRQNMKVVIGNVSDNYAIINVAGPDARNVVQRLRSDIDFDGASFPYLAVREGEVEAASVIAVRPSFVGELSFELHVPTTDALRLWCALMEAGAEYNIRPYGVDAQRALRLEKGHIIVGQDTDSMSYPEEVGMDWAVADSKACFVGQPSLSFLKNRGLRRCLVGFRISDTKGSSLKQGHLVVNGREVLGRITSIAQSETIGGTIGLAYTVPEHSEVGDEIALKGPAGEIVIGIIEKTPFYDSDNDRQNL